MSIRIWRLHWTKCSRSFSSIRGFQIIKCLLYHQLHTHTYIYTILATSAYCTLQVLQHRNTSIFVTVPRAQTHPFPSYPVSSCVLQPPTRSCTLRDTSPKTSVTYQDCMPRIYAYIVINAKQSRASAKHSQYKAEPVQSKASTPSIIPSISPLHPSKTCWNPITQIPIA